MKTNTNIWRTAPIATEGTKCLYVDCQYGDDVNGTGTRANPYRHIVFAAAKEPTYIIWRGVCQESATINDITCYGDYYGAAVVDGSNGGYLYGARSNYIIYKNCNTINGNAGVGSSFRYNDHIGLGGTHCSIINSRVYYGGIGGGYYGSHGGSDYNIWSKILPTVNSGVYLRGFGNKTAELYGTVYDCGIEVVSRSSDMTCENYRWLYGKLAYVLAAKNVLTQCCFLADCTFWYTDASTDLSGKFLKIEAVHDDSVAETTLTYENRDIATMWDTNKTDGVMVVRGASINTPADAIAALYAAGNTTIDPSAMFIDCKFSTQTSAECWTDPENADFSLREDSDAVISENVYYGAVQKKGVKVPIIGTGDSGSDGVAACWDNRTAEGLVKVQDGAICIDTSSESTDGSIQSKILTIDPTKVQFNSIQTDFRSKLDGGVFCSKVNPYGDKITTSGSYLDADCLYRIYGGTVTFNGTTYSAGECISTRALTADTLATLPVALENDSTYLQHILDANFYDALYVRCRSMIYGYASVGEMLKKQITYINYGTHYILFHGRVIVPKESFVCKNAESFQVCDASGNVDTSVTDYKIGVVFDDRDTIPEGESRIGGVTDWIPAQMIGDYFALKNGGSIKEIEVDQIGVVPASCGTYATFTDAGGGATIAGTKAIMNQTYVQLAVFVTKVAELDLNTEG